MNLLDAQNESFLMKVDLLSVKWVEVQAPLEEQFCTKNENEKKSSVGFSVLESEKHLL